MFTARLPMLAILASVSLLLACGRTQVATAPSPSGVAVVYYKLSQSEPWSATTTGTLPPDWERLARDAIARAGLRAYAVDQVRTQPVGTVTCYSERCPNLHALKVSIDGADLPNALRRCFVADPTDTTPPARMRADCEPLYP